MHLFERSLYSDREIFIKNLYKNKLIDDSELEVYNCLNDMGLGNTVSQFTDDRPKQKLDLGLDYKINAIIYLKASVDTCHKRCVKRAREGESAVDINLLS